MDQLPTSSLNAKGKPSWPVSLFSKLFRGNIQPETYQQTQKIEFSRFGLIRPAVTKSGRSQFGEFSQGNQFTIPAPGGGSEINTSKALAANKGFVYASTNAKAREVMLIDWRLFAEGGEEDEEQDNHDLLDLLDAVNDNMTGLELKYLISACLDLTGNAYLWLEGVNNETDKPKALHLMPPDKVTQVVDRRSWPYQLLGYKMRLEDSTSDRAFRPWEIVHFRLPNAKNFFSGISPVEAGAIYIDNDNDAMRFNSMFFRNGARPAGFLESDIVSETQSEVLKLSFASQHEGIDNMQRIGVLPKGVKWVSSGSNPKDMDFSKLSDTMRDRILAMFGVSRTILGTAESDTNRATAETADYVFSKRVVKPHMTLICSFLNERLVPRYGDDLYITFIDPVPEDRAARTTEMQAATGSQPVITANEARDEYMGLGPIEGGDTLMVGNTFRPITEPAQSSAPTDKPNPKKPNKFIGKSLFTTSGEKMAFRPARTKLQKRIKVRRQMADDLKARIEKAVTDALSNSQFSTKEQDEAIWKAANERTSKAEEDIKAIVIKLNAEQKKEVLDNLEAAIEKAVDPKKLFDIDKWISITVDAMTPVLTELYEHEGKAAAEEVGKPLNPLSDAEAEKALKESIAKMSESYNSTTLATLEVKINDGLKAGDSLADITKEVEQIYEWSDTWRAERVAKTEAFRTTNMSLKAAWQQSGVVKTVKWITSGKDNVCDFCKELEGREIPIDGVFFKQGESLTAPDGNGGEHSMTFDYGDVDSPPAHPNCCCLIRPQQVSID